MPAIQPAGSYLGHIERNGARLIGNVYPAYDDEHAAQNIVKLLWMQDKLQVFPGDVIEVLRLVENDGTVMGYVNEEKESEDNEDVSEADFAIHKKVFDVERYGPENRKVRVVPRVK